MGWSTWNKYHCDISEDIIKTNIQAMTDKGLTTAGYTYVNIDDCWMADKRAEDGHIQANATKFPNGMKAVGDMIHAANMNFGIYSSAGNFTCQKLPGGLGYEFMDATDYASWGVDLLKYDNCYNDGVPAQERYFTMYEALKSTGRTIFYSICNWGNERVTEWAPKFANSWRTTQDIEIYSSNTNQFQSLKGNFLINELTANVTTPGHYNDPDMLQVGNNLLTAEEEQSHFAMWAFAKAPLVLGCDLSTLTDEQIKLVTNKDLIGINQDSLGIQAVCVQGCKQTGSYHVYQALTNYDGFHMVVLAVNMADKYIANTVSYDLINNGVAITEKDNCVVRDLMAGTETKMKGGEDV